MAKQQDTITHFSHPGHELVKRHYTGPFRCDMCWDDLSGPAYGCRVGCDFAIHDSCAGHPQTTFFTQAHPHPLVLLQTRRDVAAHGCGVCGARCAPGCFLYRCPPCGFDMHPRCAKLPTSVRSARHPAHDLTLAAAEGRCAACGHGGRAWFYRCDACRLDLHVSCAAAAGPGEQSAGSVHGHAAGTQHLQSAGQGQGVAPDVHGELLRARIKAQNDIRVGLAMRNAGDSIWSQFFFKLAGRSGYGCFLCNIHLHSACASFFQETISSSAHPSHTLKLSRSPGLTCNICKGYCPPEGFAYRCIGIGCAFDVHPLCAMLPERVTSSRFHPGHGLRMVSSSSPGCCSACRHPLHDWRYVCSCSCLELHITCAIAIDPSAGAGTAGEVRNGPAPASVQAGSQHGAVYHRMRGYGGRGSLQGWYDYGPAFHGYGWPGGQGWHCGYGPAVIPIPGYNYNFFPAAIQGFGQGSYCGGPVFQGGHGYPIQGGYYFSNTLGGYGSTGTTVQSIFANPSGLMTTIARFLLDMVVGNTPLSDFASELLSGLFNN